MPYGKVLVNGFVLYLSGKAIGEGAAQVEQGIEEGDPGRALFGGSNILLGAAGGASVVQDTVLGVFPGRRITNPEMQAGIDAIHEAQFGKGGGQGIPMTLTVTDEGRIVVSQVGKIPGAAAKAKAREIFGDEVEFVAGTTRSNAPGPSGYHAEPRGIQWVSGAPARKASTHYSCPDRTIAQDNAGVTNVTGTSAENGSRITRTKMMGTTQVPAPSGLPPPGVVVVGGSTGTQREDKRDR